MRFGVREILFGVLLMGVPLGAWGFVFRPANKAHAEAREQIEQKQAKLRKLNGVVATVGDLQMKISSLEEAIRFFQSKLPSEKEIDKVLRETWRLAEQNHLVTKSIRTAAQPGQDQSFYASGIHAEQPVLVHLEGDFVGFYSFLQALERQPRIMRISRLWLDQAGAANDGQITARIEMSVFFERSGKD